MAAAGVLAADVVLLVGGLVIGQVLGLVLGAVLIIVGELFAPHYRQIIRDHFEAPIGVMNSAHTV